MEFALTLMRGDAAAGVQTGNWSFDEERTHRVIESSDTAITKLQVVYGKWEAKPLLGLTYEVPTDGNSYTVTADGGVSVERSEGEALKPDEKAAVLAEYGWLAGPHPVVAAIERAGGQPDSELDAGSEFIYALVGAIPGVDHSKSTMNATFSGFADGPRKEAQLKVSLKSELHSGPTVFAIDLEGPARVDMTTGWTTSLDLKGAIGPGGQVKVKGKMLDVHGKGSATLKRVAQFK